jgi:hypothetical protein
VPPLFTGVLRRLMAKRPEDRPPSMAEVRQDLLPWVAGESTLPLDDQADLEYQQAVAEAENAEEAEDMFADDIVSASRMSAMPDLPRRPKAVPIVYLVIPAVLAVLLLTALLYLLLS